MMTESCRVGAIEMRLRRLVAGLLAGTLLAVCWSGDSAGGTELNPRNFLF
jgi:hypothetical protein